MERKCAKVVAVSHKPVGLLNVQGVVMEGKKLTEKSIFSEA